jgi:membrane-associated phospholipid phosphatase
LIELLKKIDTEIALFIYRNIKNPKLDHFLSKINRGEVLFIIALGSLIVTKPNDWYKALLFISLICFLNDRFVLLIKKYISRKRPSLKLLGNSSMHQDLNHSFPSAHAANSMAAVIMICEIFGQSNFFYLATILAGLSRLITLHHFLSDVIGGWIIGLVSGVLGILIYHAIYKLIASLIIQ